MNEVRADGWSGEPKLMPGPKMPKPIWHVCSQGLYLITSHIWANSHSLQPNKQHSLKGHDLLTTHPSSGERSCFYNNPGNKQLGGAKTLLT